MRAQWAIVGAVRRAEQIETLNQETDSILRPTAARALKRIVPEDSSDQAHDWCIYSQETGDWLFGPDELRQAANLH